VNHFLERASRRMRKEAQFVPDSTMRALLEHRWPGNVRELQNVIERAVIVSSDGEVRISAEWLQTFVAGDSPALQRTLAEAEREHIVSTLRATRGVVGGKHGAAARLGVPRTTLLARMHKLRIVTNDVPDTHVSFRRTLP